MPEYHHWNYRVLKRTASTPAGEDEDYLVIECYYDRYGRITAWCPATPGGNTVAELEEVLRRMALVAGLASLTSEDKRLLTLADLPAESEPVT
jgi:hypothetical protein